MYDKLTFWVYRCDVSDEVFEGFKFFMKEGANSGCVGNISVKYIQNPHTVPQVIKFEGSLPKWFDGSNITAPTFDEAIEQINALCEVLHIKPYQARVSGLEFGSSYQTSHKPSEYMELLGELPRSVRSDYVKGKQTQTVYFRSDAKKTTFCHIFYDKGSEVLKNEGVNVEGNLLRYELKFYKSLRALLKWSSQITLETLQDKSFFDILIDYYLKKFKQITKLNEMPSTNITTAGAGVNFILSTLASPTLRQDPKAIKRLIAEIKQANPSLTNQTISRMKTQLKKVLAVQASDQPTESKMSELENLINAECERCREKP